MVPGEPRPPRVVGVGQRLPGREPVGGAPGGRRLPGRDLLQGLAHDPVDVPGGHRPGREQGLQGEGHARPEGQPGPEHLGVRGGFAQRREGLVPGEAADDRAPDGRVQTGAGALRVHAPVPGEQPPPYGRGGGGEARLRAPDRREEAGRRGVVGVPVDGGDGLRGPVGRGAEQRVDPVRPVRRGELDAQRRGQAPGVGHHGVAPDLGAGQRGGCVRPGVRRIPGGHGTQGVEPVPYGDVAGDPVQQPAPGVGRLDHVHRLDPAVERRVHVPDGPGAQQRGQHPETELPGDPGRMAQGEHLPAAPLAGATVLRGAADRAVPQGPGRRTARRTVQRRTRRRAVARRPGVRGGVVDRDAVCRGSRLGGAVHRGAVHRGSGPGGAADRRSGLRGAAGPSFAVRPSGRRLLLHAGDHRPPVRLDHLDHDRLPARDLDRLRVGGGRAPALGAEGLHASVGQPPQPLPVHVLVVRHRVGDRPGHRPGVAEVREAGDARHGEADHVVRGAGEPDLLVDARRLDEPVRVAGHQGRPARGPLARDHPAVGARGARPVRREQLRPLLAEPARDLLPPQLGGEAREEDVGREPDGERCPRLPAAGRETGLRELGRAPGPLRQTVVDPVHVRAYPRGRRRVRALQAGEAETGGVREPDPPGEDVPAELGGAEERGRGALGPVPLHLQLPGAVTGGDPPLGEGEFVRVPGPQMRNAPGVPVDLDAHGEILPSLLFHEILG